jgi:hypothetical protein
VASPNGRSRPSSMNSSSRLKYPRSTTYSSPRSRSRRAEYGVCISVLPEMLTTRTFRPSKSTFPPRLAASIASPYCIPVGLPSSAIKGSLPIGLEACELRGMPFGRSSQKSGFCEVGVQKRGGRERARRGKVRGTYPCPFSTLPLGDEPSMNRRASQLRRISLPETVWKVAVRVGSRVFWWRRAPEKVLIRSVPQTRRTP